MEVSEKKEANKLARQKYAASPKGRATMKRYEQSKKGKVTLKRHTTKKVSTLTDTYIKQLYLSNYGISSLEITSELIELKRKSLSLKREVKNYYPNLLQQRRIIHCDMCNKIMGLAKDHEITKCTSCAESLNLNLKQDGNTENRKCA